MPRISAPPNSADTTGRGRAEVGAAAETQQHPVGLDTPIQEQSHTCSYNMPSLDSALASFNFVVSDCMA